VRLRIAIAIFALSLLAAAPARAQGTLSRAADALRDSSVYVDPEAERALTPDEASRVRALIARNDAGPMYVAVLPSSARDEAGGDPSAALREVAEELRQPGVYAGVIGDSFRAGSVGVDVPAADLARESLELEAPRGAFAVLAEFIRRVGAARTGAEPRGDGRGGGFPVVVLLLIGIPLGALLFMRSRRRRQGRQQARAELEEVKQVAREDLVALGDDIRALDLDVEMPGADAEAKQHYDQAVQRYTEAEQALDGARRPEDIEPVTSALEEGRWAMAAAKAELAGDEAPERRPPCFFDPRHGPSVADVEWGPLGGRPRPVPVCAADLTRIQDGVDPEPRQVPVGGRMVPYWAAGPAYMPWAGGFFGGGLLPGLFLGSMLGGGFGIFGGEAVDDALAGDGGDLGDIGGGDLADFGGGDFGDFGGGGDF